MKKTKKIKKKLSKDNGIRKQKDLKVLQSHVYIGIYKDNILHIQIMDRKTGKVYAGNIHKTFDKLKDWENRYDEKNKD